VAKLIKPVGELQETAERAASEVSALAIVRSPHIVHVHDAFVADGIHYIISEKCSNTVRSMIQADWFEPKIWFRALAKGILHALHFVHINGLAHCDIHAGNIFLHVVLDSLTPADRSATLFKLGDFGLARPLAVLKWVEPS
jgi:serine/threonine protein kinase